MLFPGYLVTCLLSCLHLSFFGFGRCALFNCSCPDPAGRETINLIFWSYTPLFGASKGSMKAPQKSVKIKISVNFYFNTTFWNARGVVSLPRLYKWSLYEVWSNFLEVSRSSDKGMTCRKRIYVYIIFLCRHFSFDLSSPFWRIRIRPQFQSIFSTPFLFSVDVT